MRTLDLVSPGWYNHPKPVLKNPQLLPLISLRRFSDTVYNGESSGDSSLDKELDTSAPPLARIYYEPIEPVAGEEARWQHDGQVLRS